MLQSAVSVTDNPVFRESEGCRNPVAWRRLWNSRPTRETCRNPVLEETAVEEGVSEWTGAEADRIVAGVGVVALLLESEADRIVAGVVAAPSTTAATGRLEFEGSDILFIQIYKSSKRVSVN